MISNGELSHRLKSVSVEKERVVSTGRGGPPSSGEREEQSEESEGSVAEETGADVANQASKKKAASSQDAGDSDHEATGLPSEEEEEGEEGGEGGEGEEEEEEEEEGTGVEGREESTSLDRDRVNVSVSCHSS